MSGRKPVNTGRTWEERLRIQELIEKGKFKTKECPLCKGRGLEYCPRCHGFGEVPEHGEWRNFI